VQEIDTKLFVDEFAKDLELLSKDVIPNIRLNLSKLMRRAILSHPELAEHPTFVTIKQTLQNDKDTDVRFFVE